MSKVIIEESSLQDIADSIRAKNGSNSLYKPGEMSEAIDDIESVNDYISGTITGGNTTWQAAIKKLPPLANTGTSCQNLFKDFKGIEIDTSLLNISNVTDMANMFYICSNLTSLDLGSFDTSNVTDMSWMFYLCSSLKELDLSNFDTSNVTNMSGMFHSCSNLTSLDISNFDTRNVTSMTSMFSNCSKLTSLDLSNFIFQPNTAVNISNMFGGCGSLAHLDIRGLDFTYITSYSNFFGSIYSPMKKSCEIIVKDNDAKAWINEKFPNYTNVKTVAEYEAE